MFQSIKVYDGFSCCFRQWKAIGTHCSFTHGYGVSFEVTFGGHLDERNWVFDFGGMKRAKTKIEGMTPDVWMKYMFDHTTILSEDDPVLPYYKELEKMNAVQLRVLPNVGAERFAEYIFEKLNEFVKEETQGRARVVQVKFMEHGKNSAIYCPKEE